MRSHCVWVVYGNHWKSCLACVIPKFYIILDRFILTARDKLWVQPQLRMTMKSSQRLISAGSQRRWYRVTPREVDLVKLGIFHRLKNLVILQHYITEINQAPHPKAMTRMILPNLIVCENEADNPFMTFPQRTYQYSDSTV